MDVAAVAQQVTAVLVPFMPLLLRMSEHAAEEVGNRIGAEGWVLAKRSWAQLQDHAGRDQALRQAAQDVAAVPADPGAQMTLQRELERVLSADTELFHGLDSLLTEHMHPTKTADDLTIGVQAGSITGSRLDSIKADEPRTVDKPPGI
jgi:hypothetical protein